MSTPVLNLCPLGKKNWAGPPFNVSNYGANANCVFGADQITINHGVLSGLPDGGYYTSPTIPHLGASHHIVQQFVVSPSNAGMEWYSDICFFPSGSLSMLSPIRVYGVPSTGTVTVWGDMDQQDLNPIYQQPNNGAQVTSAWGKTIFVSVKRVFDDVASEGYLFSTITVELYDATTIYAQFTYRSRIAYTAGSSIRFGIHSRDSWDRVALTTIAEQFVASSGLPNDCVGNILASFTYSQVTDQPAIFDNTSIALQGITSYLWDFGDGCESTEENPTHLYMGSGTYNVTLTVTGPDGTDSVTLPVTIITTFMTDFIAVPREGVAPLSVQFINKSVTPILEYNWDFGDGGHSTAKDPIYTYSHAGIYTVTLIIGNDLSGYISKTRSAYILVKRITAGDIQLIYAPEVGYGELTVIDRDLARDPGVETAIFICLFTDQRANVDDVLPDNSGDMRGFWGDDLNADKRSDGSRIWLLLRNPITEALLSQLKETVNQALSWLVDDGIMDNVEVSITTDGIIIYINVRLTRSSTTVSYRYFYNFKDQLYGRA